MPMSRLVALAAAMLLVGGCTLFENPGPPVGPVPDGALWIDVSNQTDRVLQLAVNGIVVADVQPATDRTMFANELPPLPWKAEVRLRTGRTLLELAVVSGAVIKTQNGWQTVANRVDLSCGRIDIYSMAPILGPPPGPGVPGDCDP
jgi:hypothetical protein